LICVDASLAAKWALAEDDSDLALLLYSQRSTDGIVAPAFMPVEVTNAIWKRVVRAQFSLSDAQEALADFVDFRVDLIAANRVHQEALGLAARFSRPNVYDMHYVALAQIAGCDLWTADRRLLNALGGRLSFVKDLADFRP